MEYIIIDEAQYIKGICSAPFANGLPEPVEIPEDFDHEQMNCYRYVDGAFEYDADKAEYLAELEEQANLEKTRMELAQKMAMECQINMIAKTAAADDVITLTPLLREWSEGKYQKDDIVKYLGAPYKCVQAHDSSGNATWNPSGARSLWSNYHATTPENALSWYQPTGAHDAYNQGECMVWTDGNTYRAKKNAVTYGPDAVPQAWEVAA